MSYKQQKLQFDINEFIIILNDLLENLMKIKLLALLFLGIFSTAGFAQTTEEVYEFCENHANLPDDYEYSSYNDCTLNENLTPVRQKSTNKYTYADKTGKIIMPAQFDEAHGFDDGLALVKQGDLFGYIKKDGKFAIKPQFKNAFGFHNERAKVLQNGKWGFIDTQGKVVIKPTYEYNQTADWFDDGLLLAQQNGKWGFIDTQGKVAIPFFYDEAESFSEGLAVVGIKDADNSTTKYGYINKKGETVISLKYRYASDFVEGSAFVEMNDKIYFIDKDEQPIDYN